MFTAKSPHPLPLGEGERVLALESREGTRASRRVEEGLSRSLSGGGVKLKLQYFGHLMQRVDSLEKTLMLGGIRGSRMWPGFPWLPTSWLPAGSPAASCLWEGRLPVPTWLWFGSSPGAFSSPSSPFGRFCLFPSHGASAPCCQLLSKPGPRGVLLFLNRSSCAFCWLDRKSVV